MESPYGNHLPIFPQLSSHVEEHVELVAERLMNRADSAFLNGKTSQEQYDRWVKRLDEWVHESIDRNVQPNVEHTPPC